MTPPRVFISRAPTRAGAFTELLESAGIAVLGADLIETETIVSPEEADGVLAQCREADMVVFTSARAPAALAEIAGPAETPGAPEAGDGANARAGAGVNTPGAAADAADAATHGGAGSAAVRADPTDRPGDLSWLTSGGARIICAGEQTAAAAARYGATVHETITPGGQDSVIAWFEEHAPAAGGNIDAGGSDTGTAGGALGDDTPRAATGSGLRRRVALPRSEAAADALPDYLRRRGEEVVDLPLYRPRTSTTREARDAVAAAAAEPPDAFAFTSPSMVSAFLDLAGLETREDAKAYFAGAIRIAIGETTAAALVERTGGVEYTSEKRSLRDMAEIARAVLAPHSRADGRDTGERGTDGRGVADRDTGN